MLVKTKFLELETNANKQHSFSYSMEHLISFLRLFSTQSKTVAVFSTLKHFPKMLQTGVKIFKSTKTCCNMIHNHQEQNWIKIFFVIFLSFK